MGLRGDGERVDMEVGLDSPPVVLNHVASRDAIDEYVDEWAWARGVPAVKFAMEAQLSQLINRGSFGHARRTWVNRARIAHYLATWTRVRFGPCP